MPGCVHALPESVAGAVGGTFDGRLREGAMIEADPEDVRWFKSMFPKVIEGSG